MQGDQDDLGAGRAGRTSVGEDRGGVDDIDGPGLVGGESETVEAVGVGEQRNLDPVGVEHRRAGLLLGAAVTAGVLEASGIHRVQGALDAGDTLVDRVVGRGRAGVEPGVDERREDLRRDREDGVTGVGTTRRCNGRLEVADRQVGTFDERLGPGEQRPVVQPVAGLGRVRRAVPGCLVGDP